MLTYTYQNIVHKLKPRCPYVPFLASNTSMPHSCHLAMLKDRQNVLKNRYMLRILLNLPMRKSTNLANIDHNVYHPYCEYISNIRQMSDYNYQQHLGQRFRYNRIVDTIEHFHLYLSDHHSIHPNIVHILTLNKSNE